VTRDPKTDNGYMETCAFGRAGPPDTPVDQELRYASKSGLPLPLQLAQMIEFSLATENTGENQKSKWKMQNYKSKFKNYLGTEAQKTQRKNVLTITHYVKNIGAKFHFIQYPLYLHSHIYHILVFFQHSNSILLENSL